MNRAINLLKSEGAILIVLLLAFLAQMPHAYAVFVSVAHGEGNLLARIGGWTYAIALEVATLVFVMRGRVLFSAIFAAVSVAVNMCYYFAPDGGIFAKVLISLALPLAIALYSHELLHGELDIKMPNGIIAQIPILFSYAMDRFRVASSTNVEQAEEDAPVPVAVELPQPKEPEPVPAQRPQNEGIRFHDLPTEERQPLVKKMKEQRKLTNVELSEMFKVSPATISRDLNS